MSNMFQKEAERILSLETKSRVNTLGGYGPSGEVIYEKHPFGCPSTLMTSRDNGKAVFMTNGSVSFEVKTKEGMDITVLAGSFDANEKHETSAPSANIWLSLDAGKKQRLTSLINAGCNLNCVPVSMKIVKIGDPGRAMWYVYEFKTETGDHFSTAVKHSFIASKQGPALIRQAYIKNLGKKRLKGNLWAYFNLQGTQKFVYNKPLWYDTGLAVNPEETVVSCRVPYTEILQLKRVSGITAGGVTIKEATCDYTGFIGDTAAAALFPQAALKGSFLNVNGRKLNRFSVPTISAVRASFDLEPGKYGVLEQSLQYMTDPGIIEDFKSGSSCSYPGYKNVEKAFTAAAKKLLKVTLDAERLLNEKTPAAAASRPAFEIEFPESNVVTEYARSVWTGVQELYENCRAHGSMLADGIELGTRDRGQDMWPKMKEDAARVRADLIHALSFRYVTVKSGHKWSAPMTRTEKLHGMFPRQFPSRWFDRSKSVLNDNRPYNDSAVWLLNSLRKYIGETGDLGILEERVKCVPPTSRRSNFCRRRKIIRSNRWRQIWETISWRRKKSGSQKCEQSKLASARRSNGETSLTTTTKKWLCCSISLIIVFPPAIRQLNRSRRWKSSAPAGCRKGGIKNPNHRRQFQRIRFLIFVKPFVRPNNYGWSDCSLDSSATRKRNCRAAKRSARFNTSMTC